MRVRCERAPPSPQAPVALKEEAASGTLRLGLGDCTQSVPGDTSEACFMSWQSYHLRARFYFLQRVFLLSPFICLQSELRNISRHNVCFLMLFMYFAVLLLLSDEFS